MQYIFSTSIILLLFQDFIQNFIHPFTYVDESLMVILTIYCIILTIKKKVLINSCDKIAVSLLLGFISIGIISNLFYKYSTIYVAMLSAVLTVKGYILFFCFNIIFKYKKITRKVFDIIYQVAKISIYVFSSILILNIFMKFLPASGKRFGVETVSIGFSHTTELTFFVIACLSIILFYENYYKIVKSHIITIALCGILIFFAGRTKAIVFFILFIGVFIILNNIKQMKKNNFKYIVILISIAILVSLPRVKSEFINGPRGILYTNASYIANSNFPLGSGFGTYGSHMSRVHYSPLYYKYDMNKKWGFTPERPSFITDAYWAMIIGECGWSGLILMLAMWIAILFKFALLRLEISSKYTILMLLVYSMMSSLAEPIYTSNKAAALFILLSAYSNVIYNNKEYEIIS